MRPLLLLLLLIMLIAVAVLVYSARHPTINTPLGPTTLDIGPFSGQQTCMKECAKKYCTDGSHCILDTGIVECERYCDSLRR